MPFGCPDGDRAAAIPCYATSAFALCACRDDLLFSALTFDPALASRFVFPFYG